MRYALVLLLLLPGVLPADSVLPHLHRLSWLVKAPDSSGSGVMVTAKDGSHYVFTAGHLLDACVKPTRCIDLNNGSEKWSTSYPDVTVFRSEVEDGREVATHSYHARVIRHSSGERGYDLALLRLYKKGLASDVAEFTSAVPDCGTAIWHIGSTWGKAGENTTSKGIFSNVGRLGKHGQIFDQVTVSFDSGSSGGGVFLEDGKCIGLVLEGNAGCVAHMAYIRPTREIQKWAKQVGVDFLFDRTRPVPTDEELGRWPILDPPPEVPATSEAKIDPVELLRRIMPK